MIYAPLAPIEAQEALCQIGTPVNLLAAGKFAERSVSDYARMGVARISIGGALARVTHKVILEAGRAMLERGDLTALTNMVGASVVDPLLEKGAAKR